MMMESVSELGDWEVWESEMQRIYQLRGMLVALYIHMRIDLSSRSPCLFIVTQTMKRKIKLGSVGFAICDGVETRHLLKRSSKRLAQELFLVVLTCL